MLFAITPMILVSCSDSTQKSSNQQQSDNKIKFEYNIDKKYQNIYDKSIFETNKSFLEVFDGNNAIWARGDVGNPPTYVEYIYQKNLETTQFKCEGNVLEFTLEYKLNDKNVIPEPDNWSWVRLYEKFEFGDDLIRRVMVGESNVPGYVGDPIDVNISIQEFKKSISIYSLENFYSFFWKKWMILRKLDLINVLCFKNNIK